jgi:hypothetical protein
LERLVDVDVDLRAGVPDRLDRYVLQSFAAPCLAPSRPEGLAGPEVELTGLGFPHDSVIPPTIWLPKLKLEVLASLTHAVVH